MTLEAEVGIAITAALVTVTLFPDKFPVLPALHAYGAWIHNFITNSGVDFYSPLVYSTEQARGHARFLIGQASQQLDIASTRLNVSVWDQKLADSLQKALDRKPHLRVRILTGSEIVGYNDSTHPFLSACFNNQDRVSIATLNATLPLKVEGVCVDRNLLRKISTFGEELTPAHTFYRAADLPHTVVQATDAFTADFENLWRRSDRQPPSILPQAA